MDSAEFCKRYPLLYHMAEATAWPSIRAHGLLSTVALLDLFEIRGAERERIERVRRPAMVTIENPRLGSALIRDQWPLSDATLAPVLQDGMTPADWYALLNARVFCWVDEKRLTRLLGTYRKRKNVVLVLDSKRVLADHAGRVTLSSINSGYSLRYAQPRGRDTFRRLADCPTHRIGKNGRPVRQEVAECAFDHSLPNVEKYLVELREPLSSNA